MSDSNAIVKTINALSGEAWVGAAVDGVSVLKSVIRKQYPDGTERLLKAVQEEIEDAVFRRLPLLESRVKALEEQLGEGPSAVDTIQILEGFTRSYTRAQGKKREFVLNALVNAFDPALYEQSITARLFEIMNDLDYGDLHFLVRLSADDQGPLAQPWKPRWKIDAYHASRLEAAQLIYNDHASRVSLEEGIVRVTGLGERMVALIRSTDSDTK